MHDLIQQIGWQIVHEQHPEDPSKWSRLWNPDDIYHAFTSEKVRIFQLILTANTLLCFDNIFLLKNIMCLI